MDRAHTVLFSADVIAETVRNLAGSIDRDLGGSRVVVVTVLKGAVVYSSDLVRAMGTETESVYVSASSYRGHFERGETLRLDAETGVDLSGRDVLVVDDIIDTDIIDTGRTLGELADLLRAQGPSSISTVALITKTSRRAAESEPTYSGLHITDEFIHGYGLDWDEAYRDLPFIALADP